jgi:glutamine amidotransferase
VIGIIDVGIGNIRSVANGVYQLGYDYELIESLKQFDDITHLIIPGVGCYRTAIEQLLSRGFYNKIQEFATSGRPILGICLGMQLLSESGDEGGETKGLSLIPGSVRKLSGQGSLRLPHVGWNCVSFVRQNHPVLHKVKDNVDYYFVHTYYFACDNSENVLGITEYGENFCSVVGRANVIGFQFHPEKSQNNGMKLIEKFCTWNGKW